MAGLFQLEIINPNGEIAFVDLDPARGLTNIGRHPDNDVVVAGPQVAEFHAVLDHRSQPYQLMVLGPPGALRINGTPATGSATYELSPFDTIELDGYVLMLVGESTTTGIPLTTAASPAATPAVVPLEIPIEEPPPEIHIPVSGEFVQLTSRPPDITDDAILVEIPEREFTINVDESAIFQVNIVNGGSLVATFAVQVEGVDPAWVSISPAQVNLNEGERTTVVVNITPPRESSSFAGAHNLAIRLVSPNYPGRFTQVGGTVTVLPFYEFTTGELAPKEQTISYRKRSGYNNVSLTNQGNSTTIYRIEASDTAQKLEFEFHLEGEEAGYARQAELQLRPAETQDIDITIAPISRRLIGARKKMHSYTVSAEPQSGLAPPRSLLGTAYTKALIGPFILFLIFASCGLLFVLVFRPSVNSFDAEIRGFAAVPLILTDSGLQPNDSEGGLVLIGNRNAPRVQGKIIEITSGETVTFRWDASRFSRVRIDPDIGQLASNIGSMEISPLDTIKYTLTAENFLSRILPRLFKVELDITVNVQGVDPVVRFNADNENLLVGEQVILNWDVANAEELILSINGAPETIAATDYIGSRVFVPEFDTTYTLRARNRYTTHVTQRVRKCCYKQEAHNGQEPV